MRSCTDMRVQWLANSNPVFPMGIIICAILDIYVLAFISEGHWRIKRTLIDTF